MEWAALAFAIGLPNAWAWTRYIQSVHANHPFRAALWDGLIVIFGVIGIVKFWEESGRNDFVFLSYLTAGMMGTYLTVCKRMPHVPFFEQETEITCGPAALRSLLATVGISATEMELAKKAKTNEHGTKPDNLVKTARSYGLFVYAKQGWTMEELEENVPVLVDIQAQGTPEEYEKDESGHYVVVMAIREGKVICMDPSEGVVEMGVIPFWEQWHDKEEDGFRTVRWGMTVKR